MSPINQRMAFILHVLLHYTITDVSEIIGKSENATKVLIHRGRIKIKEFLCKNCSLYNSTNTCQCKNLVGFSLKNGWISVQPNPEYNPATPDARIIEEEIYHFGEIIDFYNHINPRNTPQGLRLFIKTFIEDKNWKIFKEKNV